MELEFNAYWFGPFVYTILLIVLFINDLVTKPANTTVEKSSRLMMLWVIFFCVQDMFWGFCDIGYIKSERIFFWMSSIFHLSTVTTTFFWLYFILSFLHVSRRKRRFYLWLDGVSVIIQLALISINCFTPTVFTIENGQYVTHYLRPIAFFNQYIVYVVSVILCLLYICGILNSKDQENGEKYVPAFAASMMPVLLGILQLKYPHASFYSLGYFLACYVIQIFIIAKDRQNADKATIFNSISKTYYSMHLIDLETNTATKYIEAPILSGLIKGCTSAQDMINAVIKGTCTDKFQKLVLDFVDLSTLSERMGAKDLISCDFIGKNFGWTNISFVSVEKDGPKQKQVMVFTQVVDESKRHEIDLIYKSNNDELTGLLNRYAYEEELKKIKAEGMSDSLVAIALDINGLKVVNDTLGHVAGDELIIGAATCMKQCFGAYGKIFRTGGDEFIIIINASQNQLAAVLRDFDETTISWQGKLNNSLSVSYGVVPRRERMNDTINEMMLLADDLMYKNKTEYYQKKGVDRRGQRDAHVALCALYTKILKINLTEDSFQIINMEVNEKTSNMGFSEKISKWLQDFGKAGLVHHEDLDEYLRLTSVDYIKKYFESNKTSLHIFYRRKIDVSFKQVMMEIVPANDYSPENLSFYLYVKNIES